VAGSVDPQLNLGEARKFLGLHSEVLGEKLFIELDGVLDLIVLNYFFEFFLKIGHYAEGATHRSLILDLFIIVLFF
jgi:hypothetical protein